VVGRKMGLERVKAFVKNGLELLKCTGITTDSFRTYCYVWHFYFRVDADEECLSSSDSNSDSDDDIQPETSVKRGGITVNNEGACDKVVAVCDGSSSSGGSEDGEPEGAVEDEQMTAVETTSK
jgi:hypothetical protein